MPALPYFSLPPLRGSLIDPAAAIAGARTIPADPTLGGGSPSADKTVSQADAQAYIATQTGLLIPKSLLTTKGDLVGRDASAPARVPAGADGSELVYDSTQTLGVKALAPDQAANVGSDRTLGTGALQALPGNTGPAIWKSGTHAARLASSPASGWEWRETDTGLIYLYDGAAWTLRKADGYVLKTADETVNNVGGAGNQQNDDHLFFPIEVNEQWVVQGFLRVNSASTASDLLLGLTLPTGATGKWISGTNAQGVGTAASPVVLNLLTAGLGFGSVSGEYMASFLAWITADATHPGTVNLKWCQNTATVEDTTMKAGSFLALRRLS